MTYDDVDGDDLSHGAAGARDGARTTRDKCASGEEVGEELSRKERGGGVWFSRIGGEGIGEGRSST